MNLVDDRGCVQDNFIFQDKELYGKRKMAVLLAEQVTFFSHIFLSPLALSEVQKKL